jgi:hypothetical protein
MESNHRGDQKAKAVNTLSDFLKRVVERLSEAGIAFMPVMRVTASYHGHLRSISKIEADLWMRIRDVVFPGHEEESAGDVL